MGTDLKDLRLVSKKNVGKSLVKVSSSSLNSEVVFGKDFVFIAGPCSVETEEQTIQTAIAVKEAGAHMLRGGVFKPRTSPYSFQGLGLKGLKILKKASEITGLPIVTEVLDPRDVHWIAEYVDMLQIGARNMQNFSLLREVGKSNKPVLLKRGMNSTLVDLLYSAEYILSEGNKNVVLCERGIRTFENYTRNTLDISAVPSLKELTHLPVIVDPSHAAGKNSLVIPLAQAAVAAGADGIIVEVHICPEKALSDKEQALTPQQFKYLVENALAIKKALKNAENKKII
ncbi:3-deoxy-7-phosphoheptulonate synthase [Marinitoga aeolica]|uniref:3-deoxy-7-phosphoheptulonate synthase n=1 Tax=Marinitoga aeolica TaxID=2809031 RepID=A0ABY8PPK8_9BACT|nr:3-deoxy-7-phosphoheptulonate synthase [Marinitoga aeolica]WGS64559.1 3-deoxy-7-phosphoheptulonate synthase [Marinitoga aeolica]